MSAVPIDLGVVGDAGHSDHPDRPYSPSRRSRDQRRRRVAGAVAATVLVGAAVSTAAPPSAALSPVHVATVPAGDTAVMHGETLYVHRQFGDPTITAYRLRDGAMTWQTAGRTGGAESVSYFMQIRDGVPLATFFDHEVDGEWPMERTTAYDPETGAHRWTRDGHAAASGDGVVVLMRRPPGQDAAEHGPLARPVAVDAVSGEEIWEGAPVFQLATGGPDSRVGHHLVTVGGGGVVTSYELSTGAPVATTVPRAAEPWMLYRVGDLVLVHEVPAGEVHAYEVDTLTHRWSARPSSRGLPLISPCGPVVCLHSSTEVQALDPATGELRWSAELEPLAGSRRGPLGPRWPGYLVWDGWLVDAATGARLLSVREWQLVPDHTVLGAGAGAAPILRWWDGGNADTAARTWFARLDPDAPHVEVLAPMPGLLHDCTATTSHLACRDGDDSRSLQIWRLP